MCFSLIYTVGSKWRPFQINMINSSYVSRKRSEILEKSGKIGEFHVQKNVGTLVQGATHKQTSNSRQMVILVDMEFF